METKVGGFLNKAKLGVSKLFGFHYLQELGKQNKILGGVLKAFTFYNNYLSLHGGVFKLMEGCKWSSFARVHKFKQPVPFL